MKTYSRIICTGACEVTTPMRDSTFLWWNLSNSRASSRKSYAVKQTQCAQTAWKGVKNG